MSAASHASSELLFAVERYAVYEQFASGGMATVHFARLRGAQGFRRTVAAKRLLPQLLRDRAFAEQFAEEARLAARVRHPNVVATLDVVQTDQELLLVMEYIHGESLASLMHACARAGEPVPLSIAAAIVIDALHGLHAAHESKDERGHPLCLVHRDVSPHNVLVGSDGITRIADFGIAKVAGRAPATRDGVLKGKLSYMAPEQINDREVSRASDVFAAGIVLWELLTSERLFRGDTHAEVAFKVVALPIPAPSAQNPNLSPQLDAIVLRALARDPRERYPSAREMALELEACVRTPRPSEIAAWVARVAAEPLAQRAAALHGIERAEERGDDGSTQREAKQAARAAASTRDADADTTRPSGTAIRAPMTKKRRVLHAALLLAALSVLGAVAAREPESGAPAPSVTARAAPSERAALDAASVAAHSTENTVPTPPRDGPRAAAIADAAAPVASPSPVREPKPPRKTRTSKADGCERPYSIDATGKVLFKLECM